MRQDGLKAFATTLEKGWEVTKPDCIAPPRWLEMALNQGAKWYDFAYLKYECASVCFRVSTLLSSERTHGLTETEMPQCNSTQFFLFSLSLCFQFVCLSASIWSAEKVNTSPASLSDIGKQLTVYSEKYSGVNSHYWAPWREKTCSSIQHLKFRSLFFPPPSWFITLFFAFCFLLLVRPPPNCEAIETTSK